MALKCELVMDIDDGTSVAEELRMTLETDNTFRLFIDGTEQCNASWNSLDFDNTTTLQADLNSFIRRGP